MKTKIHAVSIQAHHLKQIYHSDGDVNNEGSYTRAGTGGRQKFSAHLSQFCCEPESAGRDKVF